MKYVMVIVGAFALLSSSVQLSMAADGKEVYEKKCGACHNKGMMGAPKLGDKEKWGALAKGGAGPLEQSAAKGKGKMPKQTASADEIKAAVAYMIKAAQ